MFAARREHKRSKVSIYSYIDSSSAVELAPVRANVQLPNDLVPARHCFPRRCPTAATCPAHATSEIKAFER